MPAGIPAETASVISTDIFKKLLFQKFSLDLSKEYRMGFLWDFLMRRNSSRDFCGTPLAFFVGITLSIPDFIAGAISTVIYPRILEEIYTEIFQGFLQNISKGSSSYNANGNSS